MKLSEDLQRESDDAGGHGETFGREHRTDLQRFADRARELESEVDRLRGMQLKWPVIVTDMETQLDAYRAAFADMREALKHWDMHQGIWDALAILDRLPK